MAVKTPRILAFANQKGGATKTTLAVNFAAGAALQGFRTVLVDLDGQMNATEQLGYLPAKLASERRFTAMDIFLGEKVAKNIAFPIDGGRFDGRLLLIPGNESMNQVEANLELVLSRESLTQNLSPLEKDQLRNQQRSILKRSLESLKDACDLIVLDTPPSLGFELTSALVAADAYVVPLTPSRYDITGLTRLDVTCQLIRKLHNPGLELVGVVLSRYKGNTNLHKDVVEKLQKRFGDKLIRPFLHESIRPGEATFHQQTLFEHAPSDPVTEQLRELVQSILERLKLQPSGATQEPQPVEAKPVAVDETASNDAPLMGEAGNA